MRTLALAFALAVLAAGAQAQKFMTGNQLLADVQSNDYIRKAQSAGYLKGVIDTMWVLELLAENVPARPLTKNDAHDSAKPF